MRLWQQAVIGGAALTLVSGLVRNTPPGLTGAVGYGWPLAWLFHFMVVLKNPWRIDTLSWVIDVITWTVIVGVILFARRKMKE